jgi:hypothetical protein
MMLDGGESFPPFTIPMGTPAIKGQVYTLEVRCEGRVRADDINKKSSNAFEALMLVGIGGIASLLQLSNVSASFVPLVLGSKDHD